MCRHHSKCFTFHHCRLLWKRYCYCPTLQMRELRSTLIIMEGLGLTPRHSGSAVFAFKHYPATSQCSIGICVPALKEGESRDRTWPCPLWYLRLTIDNTKTQS